MKRFLALTVLVGFVVASLNVMAEEAAPAAAPAKDVVKAAAPTMDLSGKLIKDVKKDGEKEVVSYSIEVGKDKIALPADAKVDEKCVGKECKLTVEGEKAADGKITIKKLVKLEEVKKAEAKAEATAPAAEPK